MTLPEAASSLLKKAQVASPLEWALHNSLLCCKQTDTCHRISDAWKHIPCVLKRSHSRGIYRHLPWDIEIPLKRHTDTCRGILTRYTRPFIVPTQEAYRHLPWDRYLYRTPTQCAHSIGILTLAVGLLLVLSPDSLSPHSSSTLVSCVDFLSNFHSCSHCYLFRP